DSEPRVTYADYNCIFNPDGPNILTYAPGVVSGKDPGAHDVKADPQFTKGNLLPYPFKEAISGMANSTLHKSWRNIAKHTPPSPAGQSLVAETRRMGKIPISEQ